MPKNFFSKQFIAGSCFSYILSSGKEALIIDPHISLFKEYAAYLDKLKLNLKYIIDTHTHADHFSLAAVMKEKYKVPVLMYEKAISQIVDKRLKDADEIKLGSSTLKAMYSPGHTDDAVSIYGEGKVYTGDVLMIGSVGRTDFQNGSPESMFDTLQKFKQLPDETVIFPGHDYHEKRSTTLRKEKENNPFLKENDKAAFVRNMRSKELPKPFNIDNIVRVNQKGEAKGLAMVSAKEAHESAHEDSSIKFLDVRSALEFSQSHIKDSLNVPIDMLANRLSELNKPGVSYIVLCRTGNRSPMAADMMMQTGIHEVKVMDGGITNWEKSRLPVIKGEGGVSLERQVRVIAGIIVLSGVLLSLFVHKGFIAIPIFVACSLIFAGLTDSCMMGALLMKLPYNKKQYKAKLGGSCAIGG